MDEVSMRWLWIILYETPGVYAEYRLCEDQETSAFHVYTTENDFCFTVCHTEHRVWQATTAFTPAFSPPAACGVFDSPLRALMPPPDDPPRRQTKLPLPTRRRKLDLVLRAFRTCFEHAGYPNRFEVPCRSSRSVTQQQNIKQGFDDNFYG